MKNALFVKTLTVAGAVAVAASLTACTKSDDGPQFDASVKTTTLGQTLVGEGEKTLYFFSKDVAGVSNCNGTCADEWKPFFKETMQLGTGLAPADFVPITRADGTKQLTYKGWPLYYFKDDAASGDVKGDNDEGVWFAARPHFSLMLATAQLKGNDGKNYTKELKEGEGETTYLVDSLGRTLYAFAPDKNKKNNYTKADFSNNGTWPLAEFEARNIPSGLNAADFSVIDVFGRKQLTFKGWPLYYFGPDGGVRGVTKGVSVPRPGVWPIVNQGSPVAPQ